MLRAWIPVLLIPWTAWTAAEERPASSRIESLGLFKNGLAVVQRVATVAGPGLYRLDSIPEAVHGTFWVAADARVEAMVVARDVEVSEPGPVGHDLQRELAGRKVLIRFRDEKMAPVEGTVVKFESPRGAEFWDRTYQPVQQSIWWPYGSRPAPASTPSRFLLIDTVEARLYVDTGMIGTLRVEGPEGAARRRQPVLVVAVIEAKQDPVTLRFQYLAKGMAWAPSYRVDLTDPKKLWIEQGAVIRNELEDVADAEISLISGFPSVEFAHVLSPLSARATWSAFFQQLNQRVQPGHAATMNVMAQQVVSYGGDSGVGGSGLPEIPAGDGVDIYYHSLGKRSLAEGDALFLRTASGETAYERIVEWIVPDTRRADGRYIDEYQRNQNPDDFQDAAWDAVRFRNPFTFPMTTGPAMMTAGGRFSGQRMTSWVNSGEETTLHITKALSLRTRQAEHEEEGARSVVFVGGNDYRRTTVKGELLACNHRREPMKLVIRRQFSGDLLEAEAGPKCVLREEGVYSVNKRNELIWNLTLQPGEEKTLTYRYGVLVDQ
ncbi:MAG: hypothetical protein HYU36_11430 [Planctomycetes bacterium]|nr:hypothetical protein [Planctomycetota bacterium]